MKKKWLLMTFLYILGGCASDSNKELSPSPSATIMSLEDRKLIARKAAAKRAIVEAERQDFIKKQAMMTEKFRTEMKKAFDEIKLAQQQNQPIEKGPGEWFEGGNLHGATYKEWRRGTEDNRLATLSDFISRLHKNGEIKREISTSAELKIAATELYGCVSGEMIKAHESPDDNTVDKMVGFCIINMAWTKPS